ncbi:hypothetical protein CAEBREN_19219 [Caenorhabditis brenneri]|uniref:Uncharacterized protein n=1 Tax=Caenorhabditis brenneri TaxID=135651 RepID=G0NBH0_CAEBE|nr:hypothetical protein CAEBREN_19219 [Caenorhabditis brenneri]
MDESTNFNDENKQAGKKRQQVESPFSFIEAAIKKAKKQLESQLAELNCRIEELTEKALHVDSMQQSTVSYESRIQQLEALESETRVQLAAAREEIEAHQRNLKETEEKMRAEVRMK